MPAIERIDIRIRVRNSSDVVRFRRTEYRSNQRVIAELQKQCEQANRDPSNHVLPEAKVLPGIFTVGRDRIVPARTDGKQRCSPERLA